MVLTTLNYGDSIIFNSDNPGISFKFPDLQLYYVGYIKSRFELGLEVSPAFSGVHVFQLFASEGNDINLDKSTVFLWGSGTGILSPCSLIVNTAEFLFYPYEDKNIMRSSTIIPVTEENRRDFVKFMAVVV